MREAHTLPLGNHVRSALYELTVESNVARLAEAMSAVQETRAHNTGETYVVVVVKGEEGRVLRGEYSSTERVQTHVIFNGVVEQLLQDVAATSRGAGTPRRRVSR